MINLFQQRDFGDKINVTFQYITQNFKSFALALLYIVGPVALVAGITAGLMQSNVFSSISVNVDPDEKNNPFAAVQMLQNFLSPAFWLAMLFSLLAILAVSLVTYAHMKVYAQKTAEINVPKDASGAVDITVNEVWEEVQPMIGRAILISVLGAIITFVACFVFLIPGIYVGVVFSLALAVTAFEETDFGATWSRCFTLIRDKWWSTFGLVFVMGIISGVIGLFFAIPAGLIGLLAGAKLLPGALSIWLILGSVVSTIGTTLLRCIIYIALGFQYTNLVERQEGRGLLSAIDSIGTNPSQPRATDDGEY